MGRRWRTRFADENAHCGAPNGIPVLRGDLSVEQSLSSGKSRACHTILQADANFRGNCCTPSERGFRVNARVRSPTGDGCRTFSLCPPNGRCAIVLMIAAKLFYVPHNVRLPIQAQLHVQSLLAQELCDEIRTGILLLQLIVLQNLQDNLIGCAISNSWGLLPVDAWRSPRYPVRKSESPRS